MRQEGVQMNEAAAKVLDLLTYIEQAERLKAKPAFVVPTDARGVN